MGIVAIVGCFGRGGGVECGVRLCGVWSVVLSLVVGTERLANRIAVNWVRHSAEAKLELMPKRIKE